jgi:hypothetical protein
MSAIFYLLGLLIGAAVFFYFLSLFHTGVDALADRKKGTNNVKVELDADLVERLSQQAYPRERICPLCKAILTKDEVLYATRVEQPTGAKILIHGCRYCYRPNDEKDNNTAEE